jgi:hypothetical protein
MLIAHWMIVWLASYHGSDRSLDLAFPEYAFGDSSNSEFRTHLVSLATRKVLGVAESKDHHYFNQAAADINIDFDLFETEMRMALQGLVLCNYVLGDTEVPGLSFVQVRPKDYILNVGLQKEDDGLGRSALVLRQRDVPLDTYRLLGACINHNDWVITGDEAKNEPVHLI